MMLEHAANEMRREIELVGAPLHIGRKNSFHRAPENQARPTSLKLFRRRQRKAELDQPLVPERIAGLDARARRRAIENLEGERLEAGGESAKMLCPFACGGACDRLPFCLHAIRKFGACSEIDVDKATPRG